MNTCISIERPEALDNFYCSTLLVVFVIGRSIWRKIYSHKFFPELSAVVHFISDQAVKYALENKSNV
jgi:hypothetical protein